MSTDTAPDPLSDFRRRWWRHTLRRRLTEAPVFVPVAAAAGHAWGGWSAAVAAGGAMLALLVASAVATHAWLMRACTGDPLRPPPRWSAMSAWVGSCPAVAGFVACGYLALGWGGAVGLGVASAAAFGLAAASDWRVRRDARAVVSGSGGSPQPVGTSAEPGPVVDRGGR